MNAFSCTPIVFEDRQEVAAELHARAAGLVTQGHLPADYRRSLSTLADLRRIVEDAEKAPVDVATMRQQLSDLENAWTEVVTKEQADAIFSQMTDLQAAIEKADGAMDDIADARREARFGCAL